MKQLTVVSGKGGTGKTSIVGGFASLAEDKVLADCDVDASNLHLLLHPSVKSREDFNAMQTASIDRAKCVECGLCARHCRFNAIKDCIIDPLLCEGCGVCGLVCPHGAVVMEDVVAGELFVSDTRCGTMVHARLGPGQDASGKLVTAVKERAVKLAEREGSELVLVDGSPGIGCPVIASIGGADLALAVTEPTVSGIHDLKRVLDVADHFKIDAVVCVNKHDLNPRRTEEIVDYCGGRGVEVVGRIPYDKSFTDAMVDGKTIAEYGGTAADDVAAVWTRIKKRLGVNDLG